MTAIREELHHLVEELPDEQVPVALELVRQLAAEHHSDQGPDEPSAQACPRHVPAFTLLPT